MHYLASSLKGRALECIGNIAIIADNFNVAWHALKARFENKRRLLTSHLSSLLGLSAVTRESASDLQLLCDKVNIAIASLKNLDRTTGDLWNDFLVHLLSQKLDSSTRKAWNLKTSDADTPPTYEELNQFLASRIRALEECTSTSTAKSSPKPATASRIHVATASTGTPSACQLCQSRHYLTSCPDFIAKTPEQRRETVKKFKRCFNCLSLSHAAQACKSKYTCRTCSKRHHMMLHVEPEYGAGPSEATKQNSQTSPPGNLKVGINLMFSSAKPGAVAQVLLATAWVKIKVASGRSVTVRALLDQGSEAMFISEHIAQLLRAKRIRMPISISAVGGTQVGTVRHAASVLISPRTSDIPSVTATALILNSLTSYAPKLISDLSALADLSDLVWADADPTSSDPIHVIIGADIYSDLILEGIRKGKAGQPAAQNSVFGWVISGPLGKSPVDRPSVNLTVHHCTHLHSLAEEIQRFWELEEIPHSQTLTSQDEQCEAHFRASHSRMPDGRYVVRLPFKKGPPIDIGHSRNAAERMLNTLSRRFRSKPALKDEYSKFMREYEMLGHMRRASENQSSRNQRVYIPHHPVFRKSSSTTRLRVVFNASSVTSNGSSLNEHLLSSPKLQTDLPSIIMQWRQFKFVYTADIAKMYRQILVDAQDVEYQCILWEGDPSEGPIEYQLLTVTYGMTCAPFLALRVLECLVDDEGHQFPLAFPILRRQTYVDDVLFGENDIPSLRESRDQLISLLRCGKFELRKWASNSPVLLEDIDPSDNGLACDKQILTNEQVKVLGLVWTPARDVFQVKVSLIDPVPESKRSILSTIAKLYDPLGWVTPVTVAAKIFMQQLWRLRVTWDEEIPEPQLGRWNLIYSKLSHLNDLQIARWTGVCAEESRVELHGFTDASTLAYAASVYLKVTSARGEVSISLLAGKSRVTPIAPLTVPRLELSAALLLARLMKFVINSLSY